MIWCYRINKSPHLLLSQHSTLTHTNTQRKKNSVFPLSECVCALRIAVCGRARLCLGIGAFRMYMVQTDRPTDRPILPNTQLCNRIPYTHTSAHSLTHLFARSRTRCIPTYDTKILTSVPLCVLSNMAIEMNIHVTIIFLIRV